MTSKEFSCQNRMAYVCQRYHMSIYTKNCDLWWPQMTSGVKMLFPMWVRDIIWKCMLKIWSLGTFFKVVRFWPLRIFRIKIHYLMLVKGIIWVCMQKLGLWGHLKCLTKLTFYTFFELRWYVLILKINKICPMTLLDII